MCPLRTAARRWTTSASNPTPATSRKCRPLTTPTSQGRGRPASSARTTPCGPTGSRSSLVTRFSVPLGMTAMGRGRPEASKPSMTSRTVPSPPTTRTAWVSPGTSAANPAASPADRVTLTVTQTPARQTRSTTSARAPARLRRPETGLTIATTLTGPLLPLRRVEGNNPTPPRLPRQTRAEPRVRQPSAS